jgi:hypothetical protein
MLCFFLDPGMGVTALETLSWGVPVVTVPSLQTVPSLAAGRLNVETSRLFGTNFNLLVNIL